MEDIRVSTNRTPELIAAEINSLKEETKRVVIYNSIEIGRKLTEAKELVAPGEWTNWLADNVDYKKSTANNLMRIFKEYGADQLSMLESNTAKEIYDKLDYSKAVALLGTTEEEKEKIIENNDIEDMSSRELKKLRDELNKTKKEKEETEKKLQELKDNPNSQLDEANGVIAELTDEREKLKKENEELKNKKSELIEGLREKSRKKAEEARKVKSDAEVIQKTSEKLLMEIEALKKEKEELENKPIEIIGTLDKNTDMEEEINKLKEVKERELKEAREKLEKMQKENSELQEKLKEKNEVTAVDDSVQRYSIYFTDINDKFDKLVGTIKTMNEEDRGDYLVATKQFLDIMQDSVNKIK